ncbi:hypothetical protein M408DRAFT_330286 [Serendipita vermifera MAFF 305830]|uniref:BTB domain-containing protein n=1 Tax=Serendipita vermifera MAFF 305830 TaxID=933852 RepID=A0A0C3B3Y2_SERVB|nr:hypothetical protein M408DRAFT_330286 [Serendipita vermifera MAFF 305830]
MSEPPKKKRATTAGAKNHPSVSAAPDLEYENGVPRSHHRFYIVDGDTLLQVNNAIFKVHSHFLSKHSAVLKDALSLPKSSSNDSPSSKRDKDCRHIPLSGDSVTGWECLLGLFYPDNPCQPMIYAAKQWASIVLLANKYVMEGIEVSATSQLEQARPGLDAVDLMVLAQRIDSKKLYQSALLSLARREQILSLGDAEKIGLKSFHEVMIAVLSRVEATKESWRRIAGQKRKPSGWDVSVKTSALDPIDWARERA